MPAAARDPPQLGGRPFRATNRQLAIVDELGSRECEVARKRLADDNAGSAERPMLAHHRCKDLNPVGPNGEAQTRRCSEEARQERRTPADDGDAQCLETFQRSLRAERRRWSRPDSPNPTPTPL